MPCSTCVHFTPPSPAEDHPDYGTCDRASSEDGDPTDNDTPMFALDAERYIADLRVRPSFDCDEHTEKT